MSDERRVSFGEIFDRIGIGAVCVVGVYVGYKFDKLIDAVSEQRTEIALLKKEDANHNLKLNEDSKRIETLEGIILKTRR